MKTLFKKHFAKFFIEDEKLSSVILCTGVIIVAFFYIFLPRFVFASEAQKQIIKIIPFSEFRVVDGDTIHIIAKGDFLQRKYKIRLQGMDAPESKQKCLNRNGKEYMCGDQATEALKRKLEPCKREAKCVVEIETMDKYKRHVGVVKLNQIDINHAMVREGWAVAYLKYSKKYLNAQEHAMQNKKGIWKGKFVMPEEFRKDNVGTKRKQNFTFKM